MASVSMSYGDMYIVHLCVGVQLQWRSQSDYQDHRPGKLLISKVGTSVFARKLTSVVEGFVVPLAVLLILLLLGLSGAISLEWTMNIKSFKWFTK